MVRTAFVVEEYFEVLADKSKTVCISCRKEFKGQVVGNLKRHVQSKHGARFDPNASSVSETIKKTITIKMTSKTLSRACVEMVTRDAIPFKVMHSNGFKSIIDPMSRALGITINASNLKDTVKETAASLKGIIASELKGEIFSLKIDSAAR